MRRLILGRELWRGVVLGTCLAALSPAYGARSESSTPGLPTLTQAHQINMLTLPEAQRGYAVHLRAVVTYYDGSDKTQYDLFVHDSSGGVWVDLASSALNAQPGELLDLEGVTGQPDFAPQIEHPHWRVIGHVPLPAAQPVSYEDMASTREDGQWVETKGVVHSAVLAGSVLLLKVNVNDREITVRIPASHPPPPTWLLDAKVKLRGDCGAVFNHKNQLVGVTLYVPNLEQISVMEPAPANPFSAPAVPLGEVQRFDPRRAPGHRVHVQGVVTLQLPGKAFYITDGASNLEVLTDQPTPLAPGDRVEVLGYPGVVDYSPALQDALYRRLKSGPAPAPQVLSARSLLNGQYDGALVRVEGQINQVLRGPAEYILYMRSGGTRFTAILERASLPGRVALPEDGSKAQVTGVYNVGYDENARPQSFRLRLRGAGDVVVLAKPSWWTARHALLALGVMAVGILAVLAWIAILRRRVRSQTEIILREKEFSEGVINCSMDGILAFDPECRYTAWNPGMEKISGVSSRQTLGRCAFDVFPFLKETGEDQFFRRALRGESVFTGDRPFRVPETGHEGFFDAYYSPLRGRQGEILGGIASVRNATERKRTEEALRQSEEMTRLVVDTALDAVVVMDASGVIEGWNAQAERTFGWTRQEILGRRLSETIIPLSFRDAHERGIERFLQTGEGPLLNKRTELTALHRDGHEFPVEITISPARQGTSWRFSSFIRDITERQRAEQELLNAKESAEAASRAKSEFLANMSHEIRTPMNGILGMTELALETDLTREQREYLGLVKVSGDSLLSVINDVLDFSKIEAGKLDLDSIEFDAHESLSETMKTLAPRAHEKGLELICDFQPGVPEMLRGDPSRLRQIVVNLVGNAIKFTEQGEVMLQVEPQAEGRNGTSDRENIVLRFRVSDTGIGIPAEKQKVIFDPFSQADSSTTRRFGGTGLGLTISTRLVHMMGGRIWVESSVGRGSDFYFTARFGVAARPALSASVEAVTLAGTPVLVVDDNATNRRILADMLQSWDMKPATAESVESALNALRQAQNAGGHFTLVITDVHMPVADGFDLAQRIKTDPELAAPTIMMLTSAGQRGDAIRCRELGVAAYLTKPIRKSELRRAILQALAGQSTILQASRLITRHSLREEACGQPALRILLAEDNAVNQALAVRLLEKRRHTVVVAANGREAVAAFERERFDVVLMDVQMPEMGGFEATAAIRERERAADTRTPIIAMTAHAMKGDEERCLAAGMDGYVSKPIQPAQLFETIGRLTASRGSAPQSAIPEPVSKES